MLNSRLLNNVKVELILTGLILFGLLVACGDNTATNQSVIGGQVPPNTAPARPTNTPAPNITIDTRAVVTPYDPNVPLATPKPYPTGKPVAGIPNFGTTENLYGRYNNAEAMEKFLEAYAKGQSGQWEFIVFGTDSVSPLRFVYRGNGRQYTMLADNTKAAYTAPQDQVVVEYTCQGLSKTATTLHLGDCIDNKGEKSSGGTIPLN